jgi:ornithine cyclodeaminase/alanine dehydrogenase-like protein (mu-crystallin family)
VFSPTRANRERFADEMSERLGVQIQAVDSAEAAVRDGDIVATATDAMAPTFDPDWVRPGTHLTCVTRRELDKRIVSRADVVVQLGVHTIPPGTPVPGMGWPMSAVAGYVAGQPAERARLPWKQPADDGQYTLFSDVQAGRAPGRTSPEQVTLFINTGTQGLQFASVAGRVFQLARERGLGTRMPTEWFLQDIRD